MPILNFRKGPGQSGWEWSILIQVASCVVPSMLLLSLGNYALAGRTFYGLFGVLLVRLLIRQNPAEITSFIVGCLPLLMLLRDFFYYSSVEVLLALAVFVWAMWAHEDFEWLFNSRVVQGLLAFAVVYWVLSYARTGDYSENLRIFELAFSAISIRILSRYRKFLATALAGIAISGFTMGLALSGQGDRLGMIRTEDTRLGNPVTFGMPMALMVVLCLAEGGRWLKVSQSPFRRAMIAVIAGTLLLFSTSRGSWSVATACILTMLFFASRKTEIVRFLIIGAVGVSIWAHFADTSTLEKYIYKTFESEEEWSDINARVAQWESFPTAFVDSPIVGFGPGSGKGVSLKYSGHNLIWHSLYLHIGIECGSVGLLLLAIFLVSLIVNGFEHLRQYGEIAPLLGVVGFATIAGSIPAIDGMAGLFMGLSLSSGSAARYRIVRSMYMRTAPAQAAPAIQAQNL